MYKILTALLITIFMTANAAYSAQPYAKGDYVVVEASGRGMTKTAAKIDARRNAAHQALGFLLEGTSLYTSFTSDSTSHHSLSEKVIRISRAFIAAGEEVLSEKEDSRHIFTVTLRVRVSGKELLTGLLQRGPEKSPLDGLSMVASAMAREQWKKDTSDALAEVFGNFPVNDYVRVSAQTIGDFDIKSAKLKLRINMKFDCERYFSEALPQLLAVLDYVSEARMADIPFMLPLERRNDDTVFITNPYPVRAIRQYMNLMDMESENRLIRPESRANIYVQTRDYYFNAYRVNPEAFGRLIEAIFQADTRGRLSTRQGYGELNISFVGRQGQKMDLSPVRLSNMNNIMFFMDTAAITRNAWVAGKNSYDDTHHALFILPAFSFENDDRKDYSLYQEDTGELPPIKVSAEELMSIEKGSVHCSVNLK